MDGVVTSNRERLGGKVVLEQMEVDSKPVFSLSAPFNSIKTPTIKVPLKFWSRPAREVIKALWKFPGRYELAFKFIVALETKSRFAYEVASYFVEEN
eukprot:snap_masked-scaffold_5-processed-gene-15.29-mRNA-1 protein AED:1.00 eAED:1.00 QI:0/0/0/0/1/1/2/0/96